MSDNTSNTDGIQELMDALGMDGFLHQMGDLQTSLEKVAGGIEVLGSSAERQGRDTENMAAHILAIESVLTVILRQIPVNIADVRKEAERRAQNAVNTERGTRNLVSSLAEDIVRRADD